MVFSVKINIYRNIYKINFILNKFTYLNIFILLSLDFLIFQISCLRNKDPNVSFNKSMIFKSLNKY